MDTRARSWGGICASFAKKKVHYDSSLQRRTTTQPGEQWRVVIMDDAFVTFAHRRYG